MCPSFCLSGNRKEKGNEAPLEQLEDTNETTSIEQLAERLRKARGKAPKEEG